MHEWLAASVSNARLTMSRCMLLMQSITEHARQPASHEDLLTSLQVHSQTMSLAKGQFNPAVP